LAASILVAMTLGFGAQAQESAALPLSADSATAKSRVKLDAVVAYGAQPITSALQWTIIRPASNTAPEQILLTQSAVSPQFDMAPGRYIVECTHESLTVRQDLMVPEGESKYTINFNAGFLTMSMIPHTGASPISSPILWEVFEYRKGGVTPDALITSASAAAQAFTLPAGAYVVRASYNGTTADLVVPLDPGRTYNYTINLYAGTVGVDAVAENGGSLDGVVYEIYKAALDQNGERTLVATYNVGASDIMLREGSYLLIARGAGLRGETPFQVAAGQNGKVKVVLKPAPSSPTATTNG
jgi:hypothetical protein